MRVFALAVAGSVVMACGTDELPPGPGETVETRYEDRSATHLPANRLDGLSMDAAVADLDGDGDLDVVVANEFRPNILLLNDGTGRFVDASSRLPVANHDSEDIGIADFDGDGDLDIVVVSEDDRVNEFYLNEGGGTFVDAGDRLPTEGVSNAVVVADLDGNAAPDILIGNNGQNRLLTNDGTGRFTDDTTARLPSAADVTQDLELGDVDGDGDLDLLVGNEDDNRLLINDGTGVFTDESAARLPMRSAAEETREADFGDADGDGDLDILFANVNSSLPNADPRNRLLLNDGTGVFTDVTGDRFPSSADRSFDGDFVDVDHDGDLDIVTSNSNRGVTPYRTYLNDGEGRFTLTEGLFPVTAVGSGFDVEAADFDGDGVPELYLASRGTADRLLFYQR